MQNMKLLGQTVKDSFVTLHRAKHSQIWTPQIPYKEKVTIWGFINIISSPQNTLLRKRKHKSHTEISASYTLERGQRTTSGHGPCLAPCLLLYQVSWPISFSWRHLPPSHRSTGTADVCCCAQIYVLSGDSNSGPHTSVASSFRHLLSSPLGLDLCSDNGLESHLVYKQKALSMKSFYNTASLTVT